MKKTKIVCTLGPASNNLETLKKLILAGMNVARFNFSHSTHDEHKKTLNILRKAAYETKIPVATILDTKGPELRIGKVDGLAILNEGDYFELVIDDIIGSKDRVSINYPKLYQEVIPGNKILLNDGLIELLVTDIQDTHIICKILNTGTISSNKSFNVPNIAISLPALTDKDYSDILFGIENNFDFIAASFIKKTDDVIKIRNILTENNASHIKIISKIETQEALDNIDEIIESSDAIMVARGDLGVETPLAHLPIIQKELITKCYRAGKPVITATEMLESMINNPRPTRAEISDVANAIFDSTSAIMLSGESAVGKYPVECVKTMTNVALEVENTINYWKRFKEREQEIQNNNKSIINYTSCSTAMYMNVKAILAFTLSGQTARLLSRFRPNVPIYAITPNEYVYKQLALSWGVTPIHIPGIYSIEDAIEVGINKCIEQNLLIKNDLVVLSGGYNDSSTDETYRLNKILSGILKI